jgi:hypothetical protein
VAGNEFIWMRTGIHVEGDAGKWYESGAVRDMEICNNRFVRVQTPVWVRPGHQNVRVFDNIEIK